MSYYTINVSKENLKKLNRLYNDFLVDNDNKYVTFQAKHAGIDIIAYKTGKVLLRGEDVSDEIASLKTGLGIKDYSAIGSDEVGTGDLFGPIIICSCLVKVEDISFLEALNIRDSKTIKDQEICRLGPILKDKLTHTISVLYPKHYNNYVKKGYNLNKIKAIMHNNAIVQTTAKHDQPVPVILDEFCNPKNYFNYLKTEKFIYRDITFQQRAESYHLSVACASIIARFEFLKIMNTFSNKIKLNLPKGASDPANKALKYVFKKYGMQGIDLLCKMNFKNVSKLTQG